MRWLVCACIFGCFQQRERDSLASPLMAIHTGCLVVLDPIQLTLAIVLIPLSLKGDAKAQPLLWHPCPDFFTKGPDAFSGSRRI